jgi:hypothetical protein
MIYILNIPKDSKNQSLHPRSTERPRRGRAGKGAQIKLRKKETHSSVILKVTNLTESQLKDYQISLKISSLLIWMKLSIEIEKSMKEIIS